MISGDNMKGKKNSNAVEKSPSKIYNIEYKNPLKIINPFMIIKILLRYFLNIIVIIKIIIIQIITNLKTCLGGAIIGIATRILIIIEQK